MFFIENAGLEFGIFIPQQVVDKGSSRVSITTNGNTFVNTICCQGDDVVELVGHAARLGNIADGAFAVQLGGDNVVHHATSIADPEAAGLDTADSGGPNDGDALLLGNVCDFSRSLW